MEMKMRQSEFENILDKVRDELRRAEKKFPGWHDDVIHAAAVIGEETGELIRATLKQQYEQGSCEAVEQEAVQVVAMGFRFLLGISREWYE